MNRLQQRRARILRRLPPIEEVLRGSIVERLVRCGRPSCRCASGQGHPTTSLSVTFPGGRTEQISLPPALVPLARRWVSNYRRWSDVVEDISALNRGLLRTRRDAERTARRQRASPRK
jgi:Family of unknown function (DUF6788)